MLQRGGVLSRLEAPGADTWTQRLGRETCKQLLGFKLLQALGLQLERFLRLVGLLPQDQSTFPAKHFCLFRILFLATNPVR